MAAVPCAQMVNMQLKHNNTGVERQEALSNLTVKLLADAGLDRLPATQHASIRHASIQHASIACLPHNTTVSSLRSIQPFGDCARSPVERPVQQPLASTLMSVRRRLQDMAGLTALTWRSIWNTLSIKGTHPH